MPLDLRGLARSVDRTRPVRATRIVKASVSRVAHGLHGARDLAGHHGAAQRCWLATAYAYCSSPTSSRQTAGPSGGAAVMVRAGALLVLVPSCSDEGVDAGGCSAGRATAPGACWSPRIGPPASTRPLPFAGGRGRRACHLLTSPLSACGADSPAFVCEQVRAAGLPVPRVWRRAGPGDDPARHLPSSRCGPRFRTAGKENGLSDAGCSRVCQAATKSASAYRANRSPRGSYSASRGQPLLRAKASVARPNDGFCVLGVVRLPVV